MQFDFTIGAYGGQVINVKGQFVKYVSGTGKIRVRINKGGYLDLLPGQGVRGLDFEQLTIEDRSGAGNVGTILAGSFEFQDDRISGSVEVIDGGRNRTIANMAYATSGFCAAVATQFPQVQLWNPAGSGINAVIGAIILSSGQATPGGMGVLIGSSIGALANLQNNFTSKQTGGAVSKSQLRNGANAIQPSSIAGMSGVISLNSAAGVSQIYKFLEPIVVQPGAGAIIWGNTPGNDISGTFEFYEQAINT